VSRSASERWTRRTPFLELRLLVLRRGLERATEVVEDRDQLLDQPLVRTLSQRRVLACVALAEVVELRGEALEPLEQLVALGLESGDLVAALLRLFGDLSLVGHYAFGASCSSSMTS
jgi:hypothetical protein